MSFQPSDFSAAFKKVLKSIQLFVKRLKEKNVFRNIRISSQVAWNLFLILIVFTLVGVFFAGGAGAGYFTALVKDEPVMSYQKMKKDIYNYSETSEIYFNDDVYLGEMPSSLKRDQVDLDDVSDHVKKALVATEDRYFYEHKGVVPKAVIRSLFQEVSSAPTVTGGSTLTQQIVKNQILTPEVSFKRKAKEMLYAMRIERFFNKSEILAAYLNVVPFGRNAAGDNIAGIQAAALGVFGVDADKLNLPQAAYLAGMPKNPFTYTPFQNSGGVKKDLTPGLDRMKTVLTRMKENQFITDKQYKKALNYNIKKHLRKPGKSSYEKYPSLTNEVKRRATKIIAKQIADKQGKDGKKLAENAHLYERYQYEQKHSGIGTIDPKLEKNASKLKKDSKQFSRFKEIADKKIARSGYKIHTTVDKKVFDRMQKVARDYKGYGPKKPFCFNGKCDEDENTGKEKRYIQQLASMLIKNDTGAILGFVPGRDHDKLQLNLATQAHRSNGSTMKPLAVYAPAMEMGLAQPGSTVADIPYEYNNGDPVHNFNKSSYHGLESVRKALYLSHNVPAVKTYTKEMRQGEPRKYLEKMGVTSLVGADHQSFGIGSLHNGITIEENTNAFTTFANGGKFVDSYMIQKIVDKNGKVIYKHKAKPKRVFSKQTNFLMLDMMRDVLNRGTASGLPSQLQFQSDWAGKTGTSQKVRDEWFVATNPNVTLGLWTGYAKQIGMHYNSAANRTQQLWAELANAAHDVRPKLMAPDDRFHMPSGIVKRSVCKVSGKLPSDACKKAGLVRSDLFNEKFVPSETGDAMVSKGGKFSLKKNYIEDHFLDAKSKDFYKYLPDGWSHFVPPSKIKEIPGGSNDRSKKEEKPKKKNENKDKDKPKNEDKPKNKD